VLYPRFINFEGIMRFVKLLKTVIGSFPPKKLVLEKAIEWAVDLQLTHGIDVVSDGEQRADMIGYFSSLPGLGARPTGLYVKSRVEPFNDTRSFIKFHDLRFVRDYLASRGRDDVKVKVSITGPVTLGFACACNGVEYYSGMRDVRLYSDFASALKPLVEEVAKTGCYVQVDEPSLSIRVMESSKAVKIVNETLRGVPASVCDEGKLIVHVCGPLTPPLFTDLVNLDAPILSLAFSAPSVRKNMEAVSNQALEAHGKMLGVGCVSVQASKKQDVEPFDAVVRRLKTIVDKVGRDRVAFLHPDCGLRGTGEDALESILETVALSARYLCRTF
jgi:5-methyltetrahydropteroyltriglutamate--homocysteine methyltransferase